MTNRLKTSASLTRRLKRAANREMTHDEVRRQRLSFVFGNLPNGSAMTKQEVANTLARLEGEPA